MQRSRIIISCVTLIGLLCLSVFLFQVLQKPENNESVVKTDFEDLTTSSSITTAATSPPERLDDDVPVAPELAQIDDSRNLANASLESSPSDFSSIELTDFQGEMKKGKLANRPSVDLATHPSLPWFTKDASTISFPDSAESASRDYFYAWVQLNPNLLHTVNDNTFQNFHVELLDGWNEYRRARLPRSTDILAQLLEHEAVLALGNKPINEKLGPIFREEIETSIATEPKEVFITLMTADQVAYWRQEIENTGAVIDYWDPTIRVLVAKVPFGKIVEVADWDFVQSVEPVGIDEPTLDSMVPTSGADGIRTHQSTNGVFSGVTGEGITVGVMDSGLNLSHPDISSGRDSICGESFQILANGQLDTDDLWVDVGGHGTHVTSIAVGAGVDNRSRAGLAPGVKDIRFAKAFSKDSGGASFSSILKAMDWFTKETSCEWDGEQSEAKKANVVNMSLGSATAEQGYGTTAKKLDWAVWNHDQVYTVAQGNARTVGYSQYASAKNSIAVAWLTDTMFAKYDSSIGPISDGRMAPNVGMGGDIIFGADGNGATGGYVPNGGTSMSSPAVAGVAALLMSTDVGFETNPALVRAQLMATTIKPDAFFHDESWAPRDSTNGTGFINNQFGMGAVSARTAITQGPNDEWSSHSAVSEIENDEYAYIEIEVPENTDRLDIVLAWDEPANDNVGSAVMADLDLYLGPDEDCDVTECGEYNSSSRVDNLEYLIIANPEAGTKRITVIPHNVFQFAPRIAVSWVFISKSTPQLDIELDSDTLNAANVRRPQLDLTVETDEYVAAGTSLYITCRDQTEGDCDYWYDGGEGRWQPGSQVVREDGTVQSLAGVYIGSPIMLGEVVSGEVQDVRLVFPPSIKTGSHQLYISAASANAMPDVDAVDVIIDDQDLPDHATSVPNNFATNAIEFEGESGSVSLDLSGAARHPGELGIDTQVLFEFVVFRGWSVTNFFQFTEGYWLSRSAWYKVRADKASKYGIQITSQNPDNANVSFQLLATDEMFQPPAAHMWTTDELEFYIQPDKDYYLRVNTYWTTRVPEIDFIWQKLDTKPVNDNFADRIELTGASGEMSGNNAFATVERGEPGGHISVGTTWFTWTAPSDGVWQFSADAPFSPASPQVYVYVGDAVNNLRLISDPSFFNADVPVVEGQEYQVCVSSEADFTDFQGSYELSWEESASSDLMTNDMFENAVSISGETGSVSKCSPCGGVDRTIELNEPATTTSHSLWWTWDAPSSGSYTFRINNAQVDTLSVFSGSDLSNLTLQGTGAEFVLDATSGTTYYVALHRVPGLEYSFDISGNTFQWGETPANDRISAPQSLSGTSGNATMSLKYATTTPDESRANGVTSAGVHSSVWGTWTAPSDYSGWMQFSTDTWSDANLNSATDQYYLGIHERDSATNGWNLVASTDRSYIISGRPHAIFEPVSNRDYRIQVALRSNSRTFSTTQSEVDIFWEETSTPAWIRSDDHFYEIGSPVGNDIEELIDPSGGTVAGDDSDRLVLAVADEWLVLNLSDGDDDLSVIETIPYTDGDGQTVENPNPTVVVWNSAREAIYGPLEDGIAVLEGMQQSERAFTVCDVDDDFPLEPTELLTTGTGQFFYKVGEDSIVAYRVDGPCELTVGQVISSSGRFHETKQSIPEMEGFQSAAFSSDQSHIYGFTNDRIFTFSKDSATGILTIVGSLEHATWQPELNIESNSNRFDGARVAIDPSGDFLFAVSESNPGVAIFDIATDEANPRPLAALANYYIGPTQFQYFPTHIRRPFNWDYGFCRIKDVHNTDNPTVEVFCRFGTYVVTYDLNTGDLYISDWSSDEQPDRFGNELPVFFNMLESYGARTKNGQFSYIVMNDWLDSIHRFERVTGAITVAETSYPLYDEYLVRLVAMDVESNEIELGSRTISSCEAISNLEIDGVTYTVLNSKWQVRAAVGQDWADVDGTIRSDNQLCPYDPEDNQHYRMVFEATIDDETGKYSSDVLVEEADDST